MSTLPASAEGLDLSDDDYPAFLAPITPREEEAMRNYRPRTKDEEDGHRGARPDVGFVAAPQERFEVVLDPAALQGLAGDVVRALRAHTEASDPAVLLHFLTAFGVAAGGGPHVAVGNDKHPARLFTVFVGPTGLGRKGTAHAAARPVWERACPVLIARTRTNIQSGEALIELVAPSSPGFSGRRGKPGTSTRRRRSR
jgi:hypothetical protein